MLTENTIKQTYTMSKESYQKMLTENTSNNTYTMSKESYQKMLTENTIKQHVYDE